MSIPPNGDLFSRRSSVLGTDNGKNELGVLTRILTIGGSDPYTTVEWETRTAGITGEGGREIFVQHEVEVPRSWSQTAVNVVVSKYFRGQLESAGRESSIRHLIGRVVETISSWGEAGGYFESSEERETFHDELVYVILHQIATFNSPVWFNVGYQDHPQCSACFINSVSDDLESILNLARVEGMLFKWGSGSGVNLSTLRSGSESLSGGGTASGPVSFMKGYDAFAGVIKSGGKTRRAAKMVVLNIDHPDIMEFIQCKLLEERKARALIQAGYDGSFNGEAYSSVFFQNANNSVRVTDEFMQAVVDDRDWQTYGVSDREPKARYRARELLQAIAVAAHECGDPGVQYDTIINAWHTCAGSGRINASNPCSEFMFLDNSACNLASINLTKFLRPDGSFDAATFEQVVRIMITAQEIIVDNAGYPTEEIKRTSKLYRPLGLGYANLGALIMSCGMPYDSPEGRDLAAAVTSLMTATAYRTSAGLAKIKEPFEGYAGNREGMLRIIKRHWNSKQQSNFPQTAKLWASAANQWQNAFALGESYGYRNAQVTLLAPTGTIGFMMDCDTMGIEPDLALVKYKKLVGGGTLKMVNASVASSLRRLGYSEERVLEILKHIEDHETIEGSPSVRAEHLPVFDCAFKPIKGKRMIQHNGHLHMMAAVQPFLSGAISKTVNLPHDITVQEIYDLYIEAWRLGLKSIAVYRDGSKATQPLSLTATEDQNGDNHKSAVKKPTRRRLPIERHALTHKFEVGGHEGYITVGMYEDGTPGEIFVVIAKEGSTISGLMDAFATTVSLTLQYGVPLRVLVHKFIHTRFEPSGFTGNPEIPLATSITDYIFRWLALKFLPMDDWPAGVSPLHPSEQPEQDAPSRLVAYVEQSDAPPCMECGSLMVRNGSCYRCANCGSTSGCS